MQSRLSKKQAWGYYDEILVWFAIHHYTVISIHYLPSCCPPLAGVRFFLHVCDPLRLAESQGIWQQLWRVQQLRLTCDKETNLQDNVDELSV